MTRRRLAIAAGLLVLAVGFGGGFAAFLAAVNRPASLPPDADGIVALTGGADRVETALRLLAAGQARLLLVSGVARGAGLAELARRSDVDPGPIAGRVTLGRAATTTLGNAVETGAWARANGIRSLIVVTADYHMPRAMLELRRAMPEVALLPAPVQPAGLGRAGRARLLGSEYVKLIAAFLGLSHASPPPGAAPSLWTTL